MIRGIMRRDRAIKLVIKSPTTRQQENPKKAKLNNFNSKITQNASDFRFMKLCKKNITLL